MSCYLPRRLRVRLLLGALVLGLLAPAGWMAAQDSAPPEKTPSKQAPPRKDRPPEQEDDAPPKNPKVIRVDDDSTNKPAEGAAADTPEVDLLLASRQASHPAVRAMFRQLAVPHDLVTFRALPGVGQPERHERVQPLPDYIGDAVQDYKEVLTLVPLDSEGQPQKASHPTLTSIKTIEPYEKVVLATVRKFLGEHFERLPKDDAKHLSRQDQLVAAEQALAWALRFHQSARTREQRRGDAWEPVEAELRNYLLEVRIAQLNDLAEAKNWDAAFALTKRLAQTYTTAQEQAAIAQPLTDLLKKALTGADPTEDRLRQARRRLRQIEEQFPGSKVVEPITDNLKQQAQMLLDEAKKQGPDVAGRSRALDLVKQAEETWPELPGLRAYRIDLTQTHPVLQVVVRQLPDSLSPATAVTDTDRRAVELLFESLVKCSPDAAGLMRYHPALAEGPPRVVPLGREFRLPRNATWSDGRPLTAADVRYSVRLLSGPDKDKVTLGVPPAWSELLDDRVAVGGDAFQVTLRLRQGVLDPLALATFKIVPDKAPVDKESFYHNPVSSGPFLYRGRHVVAGRNYAQFVANPNYGVRPGNAGLPHIQEVRLFQGNDPTTDLDSGGPWMALDLTPKEAAALKNRPSRYNLLLPGPQAVNRRIYFLAVNHRRPALADPEVRRALSHAINREEILDKTFRADPDKPGRLPLGREIHKALNGPFPAGSWACSPNLKGHTQGSLDPFDPELAQSLSKEPAFREAVADKQLTLIYPEGDKILADAMADLRKQVEKNTGLFLKLLPRSPQDLREAVEETNSYDLAYYSYDFPDQTYWLWPLLGRGGNNWFGFNKQAIDAAMREAMGFRDFAQVREKMHLLHEVLAREVPLVPLWQLDPLMAWTKQVHPTPFDPLPVFTDIERWKLEAQ
jgi:peptide/nickel transport system substrate-binding protein